MKKRLLSILLILCMVLTMLPVTAAAEGESATAQGGDTAEQIFLDRQGSREDNWEKEVAWSDFAGGQNRMPGIRLPWARLLRNGEGSFL